MSFNSDRTSSSEAMKRRSDFTLEYLDLQLELRRSKQLAKYDFMTTVATIKRTRENWIQSVDRSIDSSIETEVMNVYWAYDVILSLSKCWISVGNKK